MNNQPTRVLISGLNWSGSGAVFDILKEYQKEVIPISGGILDFAPEGGARMVGEFETFRSPGFVGDFLSMKENLFAPNFTENSLKKQILSFRFKTIFFLSKLRKVSDFKNSVRIYKQVVKSKSSLIPIIRKLRKTSSAKERMRLGKSWLDTVIDLNNASDKKVVLFDQAIHFGQHTNVWPTFFAPFKLIIVHRDPRDILAEQANYHYLYRGQMSANEVALFGDTLEDAIRYRVEITKARMNQVDRIIAEVGEENILLLKFETIVKEYETVKERIQNFIGLDSQDHTHPKRFFDPAKSIKNIGVYKKSKISIPESMLTDLLTWYANH